MNKVTRKALLESIENWEQKLDNIILNLLSKIIYIPSLNSFDCPLCELFLRCDCSGCPISEKTGSTTCIGSPYIKVVKWSSSIPRSYKKGYQVIYNEVKFLYSLLED